MARRKTKPTKKLMTYEDLPQEVKWAIEDLINVELVLTPRPGRREVRIMEDGSYTDANDMKAFATATIDGDRKTIEFAHNAMMGVLWTVFEVDVNAILSDL